MVGTLNFIPGVREAIGSLRLGVVESFGYFKGVMQTAV